MQLSIQKYRSLFFNPPDRPPYYFYIHIDDVLVMSCCLCSGGDDAMDPYIRINYMKNAAEPTYQQGSNPGDLNRIV